MDSWERDGEAWTSLPLFGLSVFALLFLCFVLGGCLSLQTARSEGEIHRLLQIARDGVTVRATPEECAAIDRRVVGVTAATMGLGILSGSTGVTSVLTDNVPRYVTGGVSIGLATVTAVTTYLSTVFASSYVQNCTGAQ